MVQDYLVFMKMNGVKIGKVTKAILNVIGFGHHVLLVTVNVMTEIILIETLMMIA